MNDKQVFEDFLKRHRDKESTTRMPQDLFQIVVFLFRPAFDELNFEKEEVAQELLKQTNIFNRGKMVYALKNIKNISEKLLEDQRFSFPFYSEDIFMSPKEAENYIPRFVKTLIGAGKLPVEAIKNNQINYELIDTGIVPLNFSTLERINEFKDLKIDV